MSVAAVTLVISARDNLNKSQRHFEEKIGTNWPCSQTPRLHSEQVAFCSGHVQACVVKHLRPWQTQASQKSHIAPWHINTVGMQHPYWLSCGLTPHSTQNRRFQRRFPKPISRLGMKKLNLKQQKHAFTNQKKCTTTHKKTQKGVGLFSKEKISKGGDK